MRRKDPRTKYLYAIISIILAALTFWVGSMSGYRIETTIQPLFKESEDKIELSLEQLPASIDGDLGGLNDDIIPTVEEVNGGRFEDVNDSASASDGKYSDLGAIEAVDTSSVAAFTEDVIGKCITANNRYGAQCVSLARAFWFSYADRDVSTCGTGLAKGMMECWEENAGDDFKTIWFKEDIITGTWLVFDGSYTGHICMALGKPINGYVTCLGENQGGKSCGDGIMGAAVNIVNINLKNFIGGYIPRSYIPAPIVPDTGKIK